MALEDDVAIPIELSSEIFGNASSEIFMGAVGVFKGKKSFSPPENLFFDEVVSLELWRSWFTELSEATMTGGMMVGLLAKSVVGKLSIALAEDMAFIFFFLGIFADDERMSKSSSEDLFLLPAPRSSRPEGQT